MEELGLTYQQAQDLVDKYIDTPTTRLHCRETEVMMRALARRLGEEEEAWGIIGILHDIDWDLTKESSTEHCVRCEELLREAGATDFLIEAVVSHGYANEMVPALRGRQRTTALHHCLVAAETLTGLVVASALMQPEKKLVTLSIQSLKKKYKNKKFAEKCDRGLILECEQAGIPLEEFLEIGLTSLQGIAGELGL